MKSFITKLLVTAVLLAVAAALTGCGDNGSGHQWPSNKNFVYLVDNGSTVDSTTRHSARQAQLARRGIHHAPMARVKGASVNISSGTLDVYIMNVATGDSAKLNSTSAAYDSVALSANYSKVYFTAYDTSGYAQIYVASTTSFDNPTQLTSSTSGDYHDIAISRDGTLISTCFYSYDLGQATISVMTSSGTNEKILTPTGLAEAWLPRLSPDNSIIYFEGVVEDSEAGIYSMKRDGSSMTRLTNPDSTYWDWDPSLSPDGKQISFIRENEDSDDVYVVSITGETKTQPATALTSDGDAWEAIHLGSYVIYADNVNTYDGTGNYQLFKVSTSGGTATQLTTEDLNTGFDFW